MRSPRRSWPSAASLLVLIGAFRGKDDDGPMTEFAVAVLGAALVAILLGHHRAAGVVFDGAFIDDDFADFMKILSLVGSIVILLMSGDFLRRSGVDKFEFPILIVLATLGMLMLISANDLIALYLGLELMSLALYVVAALSRDDARASEAGLKYFVLGALSSGMLLYGASLLYGFAGTVSFAGIAAAIGEHPNIGVIFGLVFLFAGLAFKMSVVPFHMWTPDVYEGAPTPVTAFFASAAENGRRRHHGSRHHDRLPRRRSANGSRSSSSWPWPRWRSAPSPPSPRPISSA